MESIRLLLKGENRDYYVGVFVLLFFWVSFLGLSREITSGFHLTDDHQVIVMKTDLETQSLMMVSKKWITEDLERGRLRIAYYFHRVLEAKIFGSNFMLWSVYTALLALMTSIFLFCFLKLLDYSLLESLLFPFAVMVGPQTAIWWRLGPAETLGIFFLSASLFFLALHVISINNRILFGAVFIILATLSALTKESFLIFFPAIIVILIHFSRTKNELTWAESIKKNRLSIIVLMIIFITLLYYVKFVLGTIGTGYAGVDGFDFNTYRTAFRELWSDDPFGQIVLLQMAVLAYFSLRKYMRNKIVPSLTDVVFPVIIFLIILIPQIILYAKSGFFERYLLPATLSYAIVFVYLLKNISKNSLVAGGIIAVISVYAIFGGVESSFKNAIIFAQDGSETGKLFTSIKMDTSRDTLFLIVGDPAMHYEWADSIHYYLQNELKRKNVFVYPLQEKSAYSDFEKQLIAGFGSIYGKNRYENIVDKSSIDVIILFPNTEKVFLQNFSVPASILKTTMSREDFGGYVLYRKF